ncbi:hypothetical protein SDJN03_08137, partial [Cucurbita argyrosperma subsp. sororia]
METLNLGPEPFDGNALACPVLLRVNCYSPSPSPFYSSGLILQVFIFGHGLLSTSHPPPFPHPLLGGFCYLPLSFRGRFSNLKLSSPSLPFRDYFLGFSSEILLHRSGHLFPFSNFKFQISISLIQSSVCDLVYGPENFVDLALI